MKSYVPARLQPLLDLADGLEHLAREFSRMARKRIDGRKPRSGRNSTLRPSLETPLWNAVVEMVKPHLDRRGARALLARELGVHRARIGEYFDTQTAMPDAERAFQILIWVARKPEQNNSNENRT